MTFTIPGPYGPVEACAECGCSEQFCQCHPLATEASADREYARNVGYDNPERAWILSDRDAWYPNPFYAGPKVPHPEDDSDDSQAWWEEDMITRQDEIESGGPSFDHFARRRASPNDEIPY